MLVHVLRRWPNIKTTLVQRLVFDENGPQTNSSRKCFTYALQMMMSQTRRGRVGSNSRSCHNEHHMKKNREEDNLLE